MEESLEGKDVVDVNGVRLGRITRSFAEEGRIARIDVTLEQVLHPEDPRPLGSDEDRGAKGLPRKNR